MEPALRLQADQDELTSAQEAEAQRFAEAYIQEQLSTEPVDEPQAEDLLGQAYAAVQLAPPRHIHWLDGPLELVAVLARTNAEVFVEDGFKDRVSHCVWDDSLSESTEISSLQNGVWGSVDAHVTTHWQQRVENSLPDTYRDLWIGWKISDSIRRRVWESVEDNVGWSVWEGIGNSARIPVANLIRSASVSWGRQASSVWYGMRAYDEASALAYLSFFDTYFAPNQAHALAHFNQLVSGYWLGKEVALVVRRPRVLSLDAAGCLHSTTGPGFEHHDGWGFYAWHGVLVPERVILRPETLTGDDFLNEMNVEVRRVMQERMGERFVSELGGGVLDRGPRGTLYEVQLPNDPERVARYVQVQDASTESSYYVRVPPTVHTAAEAVAWTFQLKGAGYHPTQET